MCRVEIGRPNSHLSFDEVEPDFDASAKSLLLVRFVSMALPVFENFLPYPAGSFNKF